MSNRSLAAARQRRSPQEVVSSPGLKKDASQMAPPNAAKGMKAPGQPKETPAMDVLGMPGKMSIGDAIGLITIRLSKVEAHLLKEQHEVQSKGNSHASSVTDVDTILRNLVSRINVLEKSQDGVEKHLEELNTAVQQLESSTPVNELLLPAASSAAAAATDPMVLERLEKTEKEVSELKQLVIKIQTMLIDLTMAQKFAPAAPVAHPLRVPTIRNSVTPTEDVAAEALELEEERDLNENLSIGTMKLEI